MYVKLMSKKQRPIYILTYYIKWVTTSWTYSMYIVQAHIYETNPYRAKAFKMSQNNIRYMVRAYIGDEFYPGSAVHYLRIATDLGYLAKILHNIA